MLTISAEIDGAARLLDGMADRLGNPTPALRLLGQALIDYETAVFATADYGRWAPLAPATVRAKNSGRILVDTGGLLRDLTGSGARAQVQRDAVTLRTRHRAAGYLKRGARGMPKRDPLPEPQPVDVRRFADRLLDGIRGTHGSSGSGR